MKRLRLALLSAAIASSGSCALLNQMVPAVRRLVPPVVTFEEARLAQAPSQSNLAAHYCPRVLRDSIPFGVEILCRQFFGSVPHPDAMRVGFDLRFSVQNPNDVPMPLTEILTAVTVFPRATNQSLGAVCLKMCAVDDALCQGGNDPSSCRNATGDIRTLADFPNAMANFLVTQGVALANGDSPRFVAPKLLARGSATMVARFYLTPEALLPVMQELARQSMTEFRAGRTITFSIPYSLEGTVFADAGSLGRVAVGYGPVSGSWVLPAERLTERLIDGITLP